MAACVELVHSFGRDRIGDAVWQLGRHRAIDSKRIIRVEQGKGSKDRNVMLSPRPAADLVAGGAAPRLVQRQFADKLHLAEC
jgi:hypothetical protein